MISLDGSFDAASQAIAALVRDHGAALPPTTFEAVAAFYPSPVDRVCYTAEALYAVADQLPPAGLELCGQLAQMAQTFSWHEIGQTARGSGVIAAMRRRLGEISDADAPPANDPEPRPEFVPPAA